MFHVKHPRRNLGHPTKRSSNPGHPQSEPERRTLTDESGTRDRGHPKERGGDPGAPAPVPDTQSSGWSASLLPARRDFGQQPSNSRSWGDPDSRSGRFDTGDTQSEAGGVLISCKPPDFGHPTRSSRSWSDPDPATRRPGNPEPLKLGRGGVLAPDGHSAFADTQ